MTFASLNPLNWFSGRRNLDRQRLLFRFHDGQRWRSIDPFRVWRDLQNHKTLNLQRDLPFVDEGSEPETTNCLAAICEVFGVERFRESPDGTSVGMTDWELLSLLDELAGYLEALKKNTNGGPTYSEPTEAPSPSSPAVPDSTTNSSAASG